MKTSSTAETRRMSVVRQYPLVSGEWDVALGEACRLATLLCLRPMAAVEIVLEESVVIAAAAGLHRGAIARTEALSPDCLETDGRVVLVRDASQDARFSRLKLVRTTRGVRFYAAVPLIAPEGVPIGVLSVWDHVPGDLTPTQTESLEMLGRMVMAQYNLARRQRQFQELEAEHARVEAALRRAESKFRGIFENTVVGIYQTTPEGQYLSANPMLARIYGYDSPEDLMAAVADIQVQLYVDPGARSRFKDALRERDTIENFEAQIRRKDGAVIWIAENARVVRDEHGTVQYYEGTVQDITARRLAEEQLRNSEMLYHSLVEELPQAIFRKDRQERFTFADSRFCQTVERPLEEILGRTDFHLYPPEMARKYQEDDQRVMAEGRTMRATERNVNAQGEVHWVEVIKTPLRDVSGEVIGIQGIFWDVTEPKRLQDELQYERDLLQALLDHSPDIIYFKDPESRFIKASRALAKRFGVADPESLVGRTAADLLAPERARVVHAEEQELLRTGQPIINQVEELLDQHGGTTWASVTKVPIYNRNGQTLGLVGVARDITQLIQTEQALREAEEKFRTIFENSVEGIFQTSPEGRFIRVNPALARIYGYPSPEELMEQLTDVRTQVYVDPKRREEFVQAVLVKGSIMGFESEIYRRDGSRIWISESARVVRDREGRLLYYEGTVEDISSRKRIEAEQDLARQAALESARAKSEFVAIVSHEIRTPLNAIVPTSERLLEFRLEPDLRHLVENIDFGAHMLLQIVNDILDLSKIEAGAVVLEDLEFNLHEFIERTVSFFASRAHERGLELIASVEEGVPLVVRGDQGRLGQVLNNLIGNAIKFTETGEVLVQVALEEAGADSDRITFRVKDTGIGIAPESRHRIFQAFAQADGSMSRRYGGTGLGLAITRRYVELMGGAIDFTSELGKGSTFYFDVRLQRPRTAVQPRPVCAVLDGMKVLVLDDSEAQRKVGSAAMGRLGAASVATAGSIEEAASLVHEAATARVPYEVIFFDAELPGSDGLQTARRLRAAGASQTRLIALTPPGTGSDARGLQAAGISGILVKPLRLSRLEVDLHVLLNGESAGALPPAPAEGVGPRQPADGLTILLVEDNEVNHRIATELLERLGARVHAAFGGAQAIEAFARNRYDLILMDCQMPDIDGYETTRRIRELESRMARGETGRVPIVALSANALAGDRDRGLAAGMDDYLTKPLRQPELLRVLREVARPQATVNGGPSEIGNGSAAAASKSESAAETPPAGVPAEGEVPVLDVEPLEALSSPDDPGALGEFVRQFIADAPERLERIRAALEAGDARKVGSESHALKGSASYMGARRLVQACAQLEQLGHSGDLTAAAAVFTTARAEFAFAREALEAYIAASPRAA